MFGPPGSGKGTQGEVIGGLPGFFHCSSGDVFRQLDKNSELGKTFLSYSSKGELVPDDLTIRICSDFLKKQVDAGNYDPQSDLLILDGLPRTVAQAEILDDYADVLKVIHLVAPDEEALVERLRGRALKSNRPDDADPEVIRNRLRVYHAETRPVLAHYDKSVIAEVDAMPTPAEVLREVATAMIDAQKKMAG
jgi:adenylate kinase